MDIQIDDILSIEEISPAQFNVHNINTISKEYGGLRQESKAPT
jgi:hypothetical protein